MPPVNYIEVGSEDVDTAIHFNIALSNHKEGIPVIDNAERSLVTIKDIVVDAHKVSTPHFE